MQICEFIEKMWIRTRATVHTFFSFLFDIIQKYQPESVDCCRCSCSCFSFCLGELSMASDLNENNREAHCRNAQWYINIRIIRWYNMLSCCAMKFFDMNLCGAFTVASQFIVLSIWLFIVASVPLLLLLIYVFILRYNCVYFHVFFCAVGSSNDFVGECM